MVYGAMCLIPDPERRYFSPFVAFGNNPINRVDPNGGMDGDPEVGIYTDLGPKFALDRLFMAASGAEATPVSTTDLFLAGIGTVALVGEVMSGRILQDRSGFSSGKIFSGSPRVFSKVTARNLNFTAKGIGLGLTFLSIYNKETEFGNGQITPGRRKFNHLNNSVAAFIPLLAIPIEAGDYAGQTHADEIVKDVTHERGLLFRGTKFLLDLLGIPISPKKN